MTHAFGRRLDLFLFLCLMALHSHQTPNQPRRTNHIAAATDSGLGRTTSGLTARGPPQAAAPEPKGITVLIPD